MRVDLRIAAATIAVAAGILLVILVSSPLLSPAPPETAYAQGQDDSSATTFYMKPGAVDSALNRVHTYELETLNNGYGTDQVTFAGKYSPSETENPFGNASGKSTTADTADTNERYGPGLTSARTRTSSEYQVSQAPQILGRTNVTFSENSIETIGQYQVDDPANGSITWSLSGPDAHGFQIDEHGNLSPTAAFDFESPASAGDTNNHSLMITATDNGQPELSADMDVSVTITNVNEAPLVDGIPGVDLMSDELPWLVDLSMYFTDPDGDELGYNFSGDNITDVALAHLEDSTLSIDPVNGGEVSFYVVATDPDGLGAVTSVAVSVMEAGPVSAPDPVAVVPLPTSPGPELAPEGEPAFATLPPLVEHRIRNQTQDSGPVPRAIVAFALEPINEPMAEVSLPPAAEPPSPKNAAQIDEEEAGHVPAPQKVAPVYEDGQEEVGQPPAPQSASLEASAGELTIWLIIMLALVATATAGYGVKMYVVHRL